MGCEHSKDFDALTRFSRLKPYRWSIQHFNRARKIMAKGQFIESPPFTRGSAVFQLRFFPNGANGTAEGITSLYLILTKVLPASSSSSSSSSVVARPPPPRPPTQYVQFEYCPKTRMAAAVAVPANFSYAFRAPISQHQLQLSPLPIPSAPSPSAPSVAVSSSVSSSSMTPALHVACSSPSAAAPSAAASAAAAPSAAAASLRVRVCATLEFDNFSRFTVMPVTQQLTAIKGGVSHQNAPSSLGWSEYSTNYLPDQFTIEVDVQNFEDNVKTFVAAMPF